MHSLYNIQDNCIALLPKMRSAHMTIRQNINGTKQLWTKDLLRSLHSDHLSRGLIAILSIYATVPYMPLYATFTIVISTAKYLGNTD